MPKSKGFAPIKKEREFVRLSEQAADINKQLNKMKEDFRKLHHQGYDFQLIRVSENVGGVFKPDWKKLCMELLAKFMSKSQRSTWMRAVIKRYPRKKAEAKVSVIKNTEKALV